MKIAPDNIRNTFAYSIIKARFSAFSPAVWEAQMASEYTRDTADSARNAKIEAKYAASDHL